MEEGGALVVPMITAPGPRTFSRVVEHSEVTAGLKVRFRKSLEAAAPEHQFMSECGEGELFSIHLHKRVQMTQLELTAQCA